MGGYEPEQFRMVHKTGTGPRLLYSRMSGAGKGGAKEKASQPTKGVVTSDTYSKIRNNKKDKRVRSS